MSSADDDHTCPICLEPIFQPPSSATDGNGNPIGDSSNKFNIGATVPCGHLYHYDCFGSWQASKSYGTVKCPTCNVKTDNFVRLYMDVGSLVGMRCHLAEDDDISLSSVEDDKPGDDEHNEGNTKESKDDDPTNDHNDENDGIVDLTASPQRPEPQSLQPSQSTINNNNNNDDDDDDDPQRQNKVRRLSRIAKKFKKQYLQKSAQYKEQYTEKRKLSDRIRQADGDLKSIQEKMEEIDRSRGLFELRLNESRLDLIRIQQERNTFKVRYANMAMAKDRVEIQLRDCHSHYKKEIETARSNSMTEVQEIMEEHPKVVEENRVLKQKLQKLDRSLSRGISTTTNNNSIPTIRRGHSKAKDINKALREMDQQVRSRQTGTPTKPIAATSRNLNSLARSGLKNRRNKQGGTQCSLDSVRYLDPMSGALKNKNSSNSSQNRDSNSSLGANSGQYSSLASRMMKASQKARRPPQSSTIAESKKRSSITSLSLLQNKRMKSYSASRRDLFQRKP